MLSRRRLPRGCDGISEMARRAEFQPQDNTEPDSWSAAWGDLALQNLGRRLVSHGLSDERAMLVVEQTWHFYSYIALPMLERRFPMGIATKQTANRPAVFLYLTFRAPEKQLAPDLGAERFPGVKEAFVDRFATPLSDFVDMHLAPFQRSRVWPGYRAPREPTEFELMLRLYTDSHGLDYVGVFVDNLEAELKTVMEPEAVPLWLETPNLMFGGRKPAELLDDPLDRQLRGVITRAKFNLPVT
jgi:hypothetical protein